MQSLSFEAHCYAPNSAYSERVPVSVNASGQLSFEFQAQPQRHFIDLMSVSARIGNTARFIDLPNGMRLETTANDTVDDLIKTFAAPSWSHQWLHRIEKSMKWVIGFVVVVALFVALSYRFGIPLMAKVISPMVPDVLREQASTQTLLQMDAYLLDDTELFSWQQSHYRDLLSTTLQPLVERNIQLRFRHSESMGANAFALPNGIVVFTDQLLAVLSDEEFLAIAAHEAGHVTADHGMRSVISSVSLALMLTLVTGDSEAISELLVTAPTLLMQLSYSRDLESEADDLAMHYMLQAGLSFEYFATGMEKILQYHEVDDEDKDNGWMTYLSTHPAPQERIVKFRTAE